MIVLIVLATFFIDVGVFTVDFIIVSDICVHTVDLGITVVVKVIAVDVIAAFNVVAVVYLRAAVKVVGVALVLLFEAVKELGAKIAGDFS